MNLEKKLIAFSILALLVGVSSILPLFFLMSTTAKAETTPQPWFNIKIPYAYWVTSDGKLNNTISHGGNIEIDEERLVSEQHTIILNLTLDINTENNPAEARSEYYQIQLRSEKELIKTLFFFVGTRQNSSLISDNFHFMREDWFDTDIFSSGGGGLIIKDWTKGLSMLWPESGSGTGTIDSSSTAKVVSAIREAETLYISLHRVGGVTFAGNSTIVTWANNEVVEQIQLEKFGDGFLYNNLVPEDELSQVDLLRPLSLEQLQYGLDLDGEQ